jgi:hypothetical protein
LYWSITALNLSRYYLVSSAKKRIITGAFGICSIRQKNKANLLFVLLFFVKKNKLPGTVPNEFHFNPILITNVLFLSNLSTTEIYHEGAPKI